MSPDEQKWKEDGKVDPNGNWSTQWETRAGAVGELVKAQRADIVLSGVVSLDITVRPSVIQDSE
ncbi:MAG: hypothetical protein Q9205_004960 [Flavoplaca limonia]